MKRVYVTPSLICEVNYLLTHSSRNPCSETACFPSASAACEQECCLVQLCFSSVLWCSLVIVYDCSCLHCSGFWFWWKVTHTLLHLRDTGGRVMSLCPVVLVMALHSIWILSCCLRLSRARGVLKFPFSCDHGQLVFRSLQQYHLYSVHTWFNWIKDQNSLGLRLLWCILSPTQTCVLSWIRSTELKGEEEICHCLDSGWHGFLFTDP